MKNSLSKESPENILSSPRKEEKKVVDVSKEPVKPEHLKDLRC